MKGDGASSPGEDLPADCNEKCDADKQHQVLLPLSVILPCVCHDAFLLRAVIRLNGAIIAEAEDFCVT